MKSPLDNPDETRSLRFLLLTAREEEHTVLRDTFSFNKHLHQNHPYYRLESGGWDFRLTRTGMGPDETRSTLNRFEGLFQPDFVLITGTAGSLSKDLKRDSVYLPTAVRRQGADSWHHPESDVLQWLMGSLKESAPSDTTFRSGPLVTVDRPVTDADTRQSIRESNQALAVDMESTAVIESFVNSQEDPPEWGIVRVISDTPEDTSLPSIKENQARAALRNGELLSGLISTLLDR